MTAMVNVAPIQGSAERVRVTYLKTPPATRKTVLSDNGVKVALSGQSLPTRSGVRLSGAGPEFCRGDCQWRRDGVWCFRLPDRGGSSQPHFALQRENR